MQFIGELAALSTSFFFAITALIFTMTGRMVGSQVTNRMRLIFALIYLVILNLILFREPLPFSAETSRWLRLGLSGVIGLSLRGRVPLPGPGLARTAPRHPAVEPRPDLRLHHFIQWKL